MCAVYIFPRSSHLRMNIWSIELRSGSNIPHLFIYSCTRFISPISMVYGRLYYFILYNDLSYLHRVLVLLLSEVFRTSWSAVVAAASRLTSKFSLQFLYSRVSSTLLYSGCDLPVVSNNNCFCFYLVRPFCVLYVHNPSWQPPLGFRRVLPVRIMAFWSLYLPGVAVDLMMAVHLPQYLLFLIEYSELQISTTKMSMKNEIF